MKKLLLFIYFLVIYSVVQSQKLLPPSIFLHYVVEDRFTPHHKILEYCNYLTQQRPAISRLVKYGETNEHRDQVLVFISSENNMNNLESIRRNNLRLAGIIKDDTVAKKDAPAIVWLSFNVHGNEPASSEAGMDLLFHLLKGSDTSVQKWLQKTVVVIDPCLNPDGRDRYVNWYNSVSNKYGNLNRQTREHQEPWPGGRTNHYNFDLNRDWAWQTQIESINRMAIYNNWLPQIHVDYHEQGYNSPYYFAPAAEPFHEAITPWQRSFQAVIGKNHSKYFDQNNWLYFTKERFDLFYPSYGDTYPTFNGSIGMTYEQGGISGGLYVKTETGDTLSLSDRREHHFTTAISTIEVAALHQQDIIDHYQQYFAENINGTTALYKTYILTSNSLEKLFPIMDLLKKNGIQFGTTTKTNPLRGHRYFTNKEEEIQLNKYTLAISALQPKGSLIKVLFEQQSILKDSNTYDITAWSIPYMYGVECYAIKNGTVNVKPFIADKIKEVKNSYGYLIPYNSFTSGKMLAALISLHIKVRYATKPFKCNGIHYPEGTLIVLKSGNNEAELLRKLNFFADNYNVQPIEVNSGFVEKGSDFGSNDVRFIKEPKVALFTGENVSANAAGEIWNLFEEQLDYPIDLLNVTDFYKLDLKQYTTIIMPDGNYKNLNDKNSIDRLKDYVKYGGKLVLIENAISLFKDADWGIKLKEEKAEEKAETVIKKYADRDIDALPYAIPGAIFKLQTDKTHPLWFGYDAPYYSLKQNANVYELLKDGWNAGTLNNESYIAGFCGAKIKNKFKDGLLVGNIESGDGQVVFMADDPVFRMFWEEGKLLLFNAVFLVGQ